MVNLYNLSRDLAWFSILQERIPVYETNAEHALTPKQPGRLQAPSLEPAHLLHTLAERRNDFIIEECLTDEKKMNSIKNIIQQGLIDKNPEV